MAPIKDVRIQVVVVRKTRLICVLVANLAYLVVVIAKSAQEGRREA